MTDLRGDPAPAFSRLDQLGLILVRGADARAFLHAQFTCDISALPPLRCQHGGYCTAKGRLLATFLVRQHGDALLIQVPGGRREVMQRQLAKFVLRSKVTLTDVSGDFTCIGVSGNGAAQAVQCVLGAVPTEPYEVGDAGDACVIKLPVERYEVVAASPRAQEIVDALRQHASVADVDAWEWLEVSAGFPVVTAATQEEFVPQMVNLDLLGGLSYAKGCYPGQEIVARMHYLGRLKQRMYLVHIDAESAPQPGDRLYSARFAEQACGMIVRAARAPAGGCDALAVMQIEEARDGNVHWRAIDGPALRLLDLPYPVTAS
jgi:hypothetical protein